MLEGSTGGLPWPRGEHLYDPVQRRRRGHRHRAPPTTRGPGGGQDPETERADGKDNRASRAFPDRRAGAASSTGARPKSATDTKNILELGLRSGILAISA